MSQITIAVGTDKIHGLENKPLTKYQVDYTKLHEHWGKYDNNDGYFNKAYMFRKVPWRPFFNDIGLIHVSRPIEFNDRVNKTNLQIDSLDENKASVTLTGWGRTEVKSFFIVKILLC